MITFCIQSTAFSVNFCTILFSVSSKIVFLNNLSRYANVYAHKHTYTKRRIVICAHTHTHTHTQKYVRICYINNRKSIYDSFHTLSILLSLIKQTVSSIISQVLHFCVNKTSAQLMYSNY